MLQFFLENKAFYYESILGWIGFVTGFLISLLSNESFGLVVSAIGLIVVTAGAIRRPQRHIRLVDSLRNHRLLGIILLALLFFGFVFRQLGIASLSLAISFFHYGYLSLKHREIYFHRSQTAEDHNPILYWFAAIFVWAVGSSYLLLNVWIAKFFFQFF